MVSFLFLIVIAVIVLVVGAVIAIAVTGGGEGGGSMGPLLIGCGVLAGLGTMALGSLLFFGVRAAPAPMPVVATGPLPVAATAPVAVTSNSVDIVVTFKDVPKGATNAMQAAFTTALAEFDTLNAGRSSSSRMSAGPLHAKGTLQASVTPSSDTDAAALQAALKAFSQVLDAELAKMGVTDDVTVTINNNYNDPTSVEGPDVAPTEGEPQVP
jgi:hypothetical protein